MLLRILKSKTRIAKFLWMKPHNDLHMNVALELKAERRQHCTNLKDNDMYSYIIAIISVPSC